MLNGIKKEISNGTGGWYLRSQTQESDGSVKAWFSHLLAEWYWLEQSPHY